VEQVAREIRGVILSILASQFEAFNLARLMLPLNDREETCRLMIDRHGAGQ